MKTFATNTFLWNRHVPLFCGDGVLLDVTGKHRNLIIGSHQVDFRIEPATG
jgi:hypothetical protein